MIQKTWLQSRCLEMDGRSDSVIIRLSAARQEDTRNKDIFHKVSTYFVTQDSLSMDYIKNGTQFVQGITIAKRFHIITMVLTSWKHKQNSENLFNTGYPLSLCAWEWCILR
jgi:hypothetical protein